MVDVAQLVRVADCGSVGRGFEPHLPPKKQREKGFDFHEALSLFITMLITLKILITADISGL